MKYLFFRTALILFIVVFLGGCKKQNCLTNNEKISTFIKSKNKIKSNSYARGEIVYRPEDYNIIGQLHNDGLDYVFDTTFKVNPNSKDIDINNAAIDFIYKQNTHVYGSNVDLSYYDTEDFKKLIRTSCSGLTLSEFIENNQQKFTENQVIAIKKLSNILSNNKIPFEEVIASIYQLEDDAQENVDNPELPFIFCVTRLAKYSLEYWHSSKGDLWLKKLNTIGGTSVAKVNWDVVATADVFGFLGGTAAGFNTGAVIGGLALGVETAGVAAGVGAVLGGLAGATVTGLTAAIGASGHALAIEIVASLFN